MVSLLHEGVIKLVRDRPRSAPPRPARSSAQRNAETSRRV